ncbi:MAG: acetoacetate--CoA ligase [Candidatus Marinimicrobia bacterium]|nr:acetoacetate--CoA ligase [Candidatus Neomarinimicrobiota bacterium]
MDNNQVLWSPSEDQINNSQMMNFINYVNKVHRLKINNYSNLYKWSIEHIDLFWNSFRQYSEIKFSNEPFETIDNINFMPGATWFNGAKLNFAENLLKYRNNQIALRFFGEDKVFKEISYNDLYEQTSKIASYLISIGIKSGDKVVGYIPNLPETVICMLATTSLGAIWSSCSPDFGVSGVLDRFKQIEPKLLIISDGYFYKGKSIYYSDKVNKVVEDLPSLDNVIEINYINSENNYQFEVTNYFLLQKKYLLHDMEFSQLPFNHPLYIMYSSGTTGKPKSIVHSTGGTLLQHLKELMLHVDLKQNDNLFYYTTCGWMMWNWLVSGLAIGATINLFDGNPFYPTNDYLLKLANQYSFNIFGTSAKYISTLEKLKVSPKSIGKFLNLKSILSTGSPLMDENYDFVYNHWKNNVQLSSISGGTDIISCFVLGNPILPVRKGELQCRGLGMAVESFNSNGASVINEQGELVCTKPFPSMPIYFWNDKGNEKYLNAYFNQFENCWTHGDFIEINSHGGVKILGRSDATLNPGGVRIGTAEIYRVVENLIEVDDSLIIGQTVNNDQRIILFIKLNQNKKLDEKMKMKIKQRIKQNCSPRHIPEIILEVKEIPYTINGKKVEIAVKNIIEGIKVKNKDALLNPNSLDQFVSIPELLL